MKERNEPSSTARGEMYLSAYVNIIPSGIRRSSMHNMASSRLSYMGSCFPSHPGQTGAAQPPAVGKQFQQPKRPT